MWLHISFFNFLDFLRTDFLFDIRVCREKFQYFNVLVQGIYKNGIYLKLQCKNFGETFNWQPFSDIFIMVVKEMNVE